MSAERPPADRLRSLVKEATPLPWTYITAAFPGQPLSSDMADRQLMYLAPQLAELVADMADELRRHSSSSESHGWTAYVNQPKADALLARLAALFPEDSA